MEDKKRMRARNLNSHGVIIMVILLKLLNGLINSFKWCYTTTKYDTNSKNASDADTHAKRFSVFMEGKKEAKFMAPRMLGRTIKKVYRDAKGKSFISCLRRELIGSRSILDLGCGRSSPIRFCSVSYAIGVDIFSPYLIEAKRKKIYDDYVLADVRKLCFRKNSFDCVTAIDLIEHLPKRDGYNLLAEMEKVARARAFQLLCVKILNNTFSILENAHKDIKKLMRKNGTIRFNHSCELE